VRIPAANVLGPVDGGWGVTLTTLANERASIGGGHGVDVVAGLIAALQERGRAGDPVLRDQVVRTYIHSRLLKYLGWRAQTAVDRGRAPGPETSVIKLAHSLHQAEIGETALAMLGADATLVDYTALESTPWQVRFLAQWAMRIGGGTEQVQRNILGERILGLPREPRVDKDVPFREAARA
jgi:alkylation response protein AidB-like acyl-CoA dehydrogenase